MIRKYGMDYRALSILACPKFILYPIEPSPIKTRDSWTVRVASLDRVVESLGNPLDNGKNKDAKQICLRLNREAKH